MTQGSTKRRTWRAWLVAVTATAIAITGLGQLAPGATPPAYAASTYVNETFSDHANNWTRAAGSWGITSGRFSNCSSPGDCNGAGIQRAWFGAASDTNGYVLEADIRINGTGEECKLIYSNAQNNEDYRVDIRRNGNQVKVQAGPGNVATWTPSGGHAAIAGGGAQYHLKITVSRTSLTVAYKQGSETLDTVLSINPNIKPDGSIGVGSYAGTCDFDNVTVTGEEGIGDGVTKLLPVLGYERTQACNEGPDNPFKPGEVLSEANCDRPLFQPWNRDSQVWWNEMVNEIDSTGIPQLLAHNRGCWTTGASELHGSGDMCPRQLTKLLTALTAQGSALKIGMFDDFPTAAYQRQSEQGGGYQFDASNSALWQTYMWDKRWKIFYDTVPRSLDFTVNGRPFIHIWSPAGQFSNTQGNLSQMLDFLRAKTMAEYGFNPFIMVDKDFYLADTTLNGKVDAVNSWFDQSTGTSTLPAYSYGGYTGATVVPSYRYPQYAPGCGTACYELPREHGSMLISALDRQTSTNFVMLEGWTNIIEGAGYYRSLEGNAPNGCTQAGDQNTVDFPNQPINILKRYANPGGTTVYLQAEAADSYVSGSTGNIGGLYRVTNPGGSACTYNSLSVQQIGSGPGYAVGNITLPNSRLTFRDNYLPAGTYKVAVTYATPNATAQFCVKINGSAQTCITPPSTGSYTSYSTVTVATIPLHKGLATVTLTLPPNVAVNIDRVTVKP